MPVKSNLNSNSSTTETVETSKIRSSSTIKTSKTHRKKDVKIGKRIQLHSKM